VESNPRGNCALAIFLYEYAHPADMWKIEGPETASNARCPLGKLRSVVRSEPNRYNVTMLHEPCSNCNFISTFHLRRTIIPVVLRSYLDQVVSTDSSKILTQLVKTSKRSHSLP
jgi:hypothetical protein